MRAAPAVDLGPPCLQRLEVGARLPGLPHPDQLLERVAGVAHDRQVDPHVLVDRAGIDVDMDLLGVGRELGELAGDAVVEARADIDQHVAVIHCQVGFVGAVHAEHAEELLVRRRKRAEPHQRVGDGIARHVHELGEQLGRLRPRIDHAAAGVEDRLPGGSDQLDRLLDPGELGLDLRAVALVLHGLVGRHIVALVHQHVLGQVDHDRPGTARTCHVKGLVDRARESAHGLHKIIVLGTGPRDARGVGFLEGVIADQMGRHLPGQADDGNGIHQRVGEAGHGVGGARTGGHQHHAHLAGRTRVAFGGVHGRLLVAHQDVAQPVLLEQGVVNGKDRTARIAEDDLDFLVDQGFHQQIGASRGGLLGLHDTGLLSDKCAAKQGLRRRGRYNRGLGGSTEISTKCKVSGP